MLEGFRRICCGASWGPRHGLPCHKVKMVVFLVKWNDLQGFWARWSDPGGRSTPCHKGGGKGFSTSWIAKISSNFILNFNWEILWLRFLGGSHFQQVWVLVLGGASHFTQSLWSRPIQGRFKKRQKKLSGTWKMFLWMLPLGSRLKELRRRSRGSFCGFFGQTASSSAPPQSLG